SIGPRLPLTNDEADLERVVVDVRVQHGVVEILRRVGIDKDACGAVFDHDVAFGRLVCDGVIPRAVGRGGRTGRDAKTRGRAAILTDDVFDDGADRLRCEREHGRSIPEERSGPTRSGKAWAWKLDPAGTPGSPIARRGSFFATLTLCSRV